MGLFSKLQGVREPAEGVAPVPPEELQSRLLALNADQIPFVISQGPGGEDGDVIAEWKIVDAQWYEIFAKASLSKTHRIYLTLNPGSSEARALEESWDVEWRAGVPNLSISAEVVTRAGWTFKPVLRKGKL